MRKVGYHSGLSRPERMQAIDAFGKRLGVSPATVRRELAEMALRGFDTIHTDTGATDDMVAPFQAKGIRIERV